MSYSSEIPDETYEILSCLAAARGQKPEDLLDQWLREVRTQVAALPPSETPVNGVPSAYNPSTDPLASFPGAFEATAPDIVRNHDAYPGEA
jgi:hypothetical protein